MGGCQSTHMSAQTTPKNTPTWGDDDDGVTQRTTIADPSAVALVGPSTSSPSGSSHAAPSSTSAPEQQQQQQQGLTNSRSSAASENNVTTTTPTPTPPLRGPPPLLTAAAKTSPQLALVGITSQEGQTAGGGGGGNESCSMSSFSVPDEATCFNPMTATAQQRSKENSNSNPNIIIRSPLLQSPQEQQQSLPAPAQPLSPSPFCDIHNNSNNYSNHDDGTTTKPLFSFISPLDAEKPRGRKVSATTLPQFQMLVDNTTSPSGAGAGAEKVQQQQNEDCQEGRHLPSTHLQVRPPVQPNGDGSDDQQPTGSFDVGVSNVSVGVESGSTDSCDGTASDSNVATASAVAGDVEEVREVKEEDNTDDDDTEGVAAAAAPPVVDEDKKLLFPSLSSSETSTASASCDVIIVTTNNATGTMMEFVSPQHQHTKPKPPPPQQPPALSSAFALPVPRHAIQSKHPALGAASSSRGGGGGGGADDDGDALGNDTAPLPFVTGGYRVAAARHR